MIIKNIQHSKRKYIKDLKYNGKRFLIYFLANNLIGIAFAFVFFYIEHCYDVVEESKSYRESSFVKICTERREVLNGTSNDSLVVNTFLKSLDRFCSNDTTIDRDVQCKLNRYTFTIWLEYVTSIQYTIGFGNIVTRSMLGKLMTMISMLPLIVLNTIYYCYFGNSAMTVLKLVIIAIESRIFKHKTITRFQRKLILSQLILMVAIISGYVLLIRRTSMKNETDFDIIYAAFVVFSTIGFGDVVYNRREFSEVEGFEFFIFFHQLFFVAAFAMVASLITTVIEIISRERKSDPNDQIYENEHKDTTQT